MDEQPLSQTEVEAMVRSYLARVLRRYTPLVVGAVAFLLIVTLVPTKSPKQDTLQNTGSGSQAQGSQVQTGATDTTLAGDAGASTANSVAAAGGSTVSGKTSTGAKISFTAPAAAGTAGVTRGGVNCNKGVLQVPWSVYAPECIPAYKGSNGGITSWGVSGDTITLAFRRTNSAEEKAAFAAAGSAAPGSDDQYLADARAYADLFNKQYELYGRKVVIKDYMGQGDNLQEDQGQNLQGAQADAATVHDTVKAFMDVSQSPTLASTQPYEEDLAHEKVVAIGGLGLPKSWFKEFSPWEFSPIVDGTTAATATVNLLCNRAANMNAIFAGDLQYQNSKRVFGLIAPNNPRYQEVAKQISDGLKGCGSELKLITQYAIDVSRFADESASIMAQMKVNGVSSVLCFCDPIVSIFLSNNADGQAYHPEWFTTYWGDPVGRENSQTQWNHAITGNGTYPPKLQSEAYKVFKLASPNAEPQEQYYPVAYYLLNYVFGALQRAGPNLNPQSFAQGVFSMARTARGDAGIWSGGAEAYDPIVESQVGYWDPKATSNFDGKPGAWLSCDNGTWFTDLDAATWGQAHTQLHCQGK